MLGPVIVICFSACVFIGIYHDLNQMLNCPYILYQSAIQDVVVYTFAKIVTTTAPRTIKNIVDFRNK